MIDPRRPSDVIDDDVSEPGMAHGPACRPAQGRSEAAMAVGPAAAGRHVPQPLPADARGFNLRRRPDLVRVPDSGKPRRPAEPGGLRARLPPVRLAAETAASGAPVGRAGRSLGDARCPRSRMRRSKILRSARTAAGARREREPGLPVSRRTATRFSARLAVEEWESFTVPTISEARPGCRAQDDARVRSLLALPLQEGVSRARRYLPSQPRRPSGACLRRPRLVLHDGPDRRGRLPRFVRPGADASSLHSRRPSSDDRRLA